MVEKLKNFIGGQWLSSDSVKTEKVFNPATEEILAEVPLSTEEETKQAIETADQAFETWQQVPVMKRAKLLLAYYQLLCENQEELARIITQENGKTLADARGEVGRGIENVQFASNIPTLLMGDSLSTIATDVEIVNYRYPIGVIGAITPFNFPMMVPCWIFPMAIACGNTVVLKPSEKTPMLSKRLVELFEEAGFPSGILSLVNGANDVVNELLNNSKVKGISFVGSETVGRYIYERGSKNLKRVQALTSAKNHAIILNDANVDETIKALVGSAFGSAGERCMATSVAVVEEKIYDEFVEKLLIASKELILGNGLNQRTTLGPVIRKESQKRMIEQIANGKREGAHLLLDGRKNLPGKGYFVGPTIFTEVTCEMELWQKELFAPILCICKVADLDEGIQLTNRSPYANGACLFTNQANAIRRFREKIDAGMLGINIGVPAPIAFYPFSGWKASFYGTLPCNGKDSVEFYTRKKVITSRLAY